MEVKDMYKLSSRVIIGALGMVSIASVCVACNMTSNKALATEPNVSQISSSNSIVSENSELLSSNRLEASTISSKSSSQSNSINSTIMSSSVKSVVSSAPSSQKKVTRMAEDNTVSTSSEVSTQTSSTTSTSTTKHLQYGVVNPETGAYVPTSDPNYEKYKAELGGDAGTVPDNKSTACIAVLERIKAKTEANSNSSTTNSETN
jgi:hypothetical protein